MELVRPATAEEAVSALGRGAVGLAGGTDLVPLLRDGTVHAETLVHLADAIPRGIDPSTRLARGTTVGAGTTLAELEIDPQIPDVLREACARAASPQLRSMGTIGGNLRQATRCWYWRLRYPCYLHGGDRCHARAGQHREHAIFANDRCASAHPSDVAAALLALDTTIRTDRRELPIADLYRLPTDDDRDVVALERDELVLELEVPTADASVYLKAMDRRTWAFPLVGVAVARVATGVRVALAGVAPTPWLLPRVDDLDAATPLPQTEYKVELARVLVRRALAAVGQ